MRWRTFRPRDGSSLEESAFGGVKLDGREKAIVAVTVVESRRMVKSACCLDVYNLVLMLVNSSNLACSDRDKDKEKEEDEFMC